MRERLARLGNHSFEDVNPVLLGLVSIAVVGAVVAGVFAVGTLGLLQDRYSMSGVFASSGGLRTGDVVRVAGLDVGEVTGIHPDFEVGQVVVTWEVDSGVDLGPDTRADIKLATLLGGTYLRLSGPVTEPFVAALPSAERRIPIERTSVPATVDQVLDSATRTVEQLDVDNVETLLRQLGDLTLDSGDDVGSLAANLASVGAALTTRQAQLDELVSNVDRIVTTLASKDAAIAALIDDAGYLLGEIARRRDDLATLLGAGSDVVVALDGIVAAHEADVRAILDDLHATLGVTDARLPELNQSLAFVGPTFEGVVRSASQGAWIDAIGSGVPFVDLRNLLELVAGDGG